MIGAQTVSEDIDCEAPTSRGAVLALGTAFLALFCIVGLSLWDVSGSYTRGFSALIGIALLGAVIALALPARRKTA